MKIINADLHKCNDVFSNHLHLTYVVYILFNFFFLEFRLGTALLLLLLLLLLSVGS